uniref:Ig-like domain-containing protein n=1 Tax=Stegastes partitus TaxID=144197 RepID=A0A3B5BN63_9TELE
MFITLPPAPGVNGPCSAQYVNGGDFTVGPRVVPPNITLHPVWDGEVENSRVRLICTLSGFFPDQLSVDWQRDNQHTVIAQVSRKLQSTGTDEKTFTYSSEIEPDVTEWATGSNFICKSIHEGSEYRKTINICQSTYARLLSHRALELAQINLYGITSSCSPFKSPSFHSCGDSQLQDCNDDI